MPSSYSAKSSPLGDKLRYLDATIPLCVLTQEPAKKVVNCLLLMEDIESGLEKVKTNVFTIAEITRILIAHEKDQPQKVREQIGAFLESQGLIVVDVDKDVCVNALDLMSKHSVGFVEACHVRTMKAHDIKEIYSLDPHYDKFKGINRLEKLAL